MPEENDLMKAVKAQENTESFEDYKTRLNTIQEGLGEEDDLYNLKGAYDGGLEPEQAEDGTFHLGSRNPITGEGLKSPDHPTFNEYLKGEEEAGYTVYQKDGKYYSSKDGEEIVTDKPRNAEEKLLAERYGSVKAQETVATEKQEFERINKEAKEAAETGKLLTKRKEYDRIYKQEYLKVKAERPDLDPQQIEPIVKNIIDSGEYDAIIKETPLEKTQREAKLRMELYYKDHPNRDAAIAAVAAEYEVASESLVNTEATIKQIKDDIPAHLKVTEDAIIALADNNIGDLKVGRYINEKGVPALYHNGELDPENEAEFQKISDEYDSYTNEALATIKKLSADYEANLKDLNNLDLMKDAANKNYNLTDAVLAEMGAGFLSIGASAFIIDGLLKSATGNPMGDAQIMVSRKAMKESREGLEEEFPTKMTYQEAIDHGEKWRFSARTIGEQAPNIAMAMVGAGAGTALGMSSAAASTMVATSFGVTSAGQKYDALTTSQEIGEDAKKQLKTLEENKGFISEKAYLSQKYDLERAVADGDISPEEKFAAVTMTGIIEGVITRYIGTVPNAAKALKILRTPNKVVNNMIKADYTATKQFFKETGKATTGEIIEETTIEGLSTISDGLILDRQMDFSQLDDVAVTSIITSGAMNVPGSAYSAIVTEASSYQYKKLVDTKLKNITAFKSMLMNTDLTDTQRTILHGNINKEIKEVANITESVEADALLLGADNMKELLSLSGMREKLLKQAGVKPSDNMDITKAKMVEHLKTLTDSQQKEFKNQFNYMEDRRRNILGSINYDNAITEVFGDRGADIAKDLPTEMTPEEKYRAVYKVVKGEVNGNAKRIFNGDKAQITPDNSENYANLTEDENGDFVFYHKTNEDFTEIDPAMSGKNKATSPAEAAAIAKVGGVSMYYTKPEQGEGMVTGKKKHMVKVAKEKVYDANSDINNYAPEAKRRHAKEHPGKGYDANTEIAYITKIAGENGFDMVVSSWKNETRAQSTKKMKPTETQESDGNIITKDFTKTYDSNTTKGWESKQAETKLEKMKPIYKKISDVFNRAQDYGNKLYNLYKETAVNFDSDSAMFKDQAEITKLVNESNIDQALKDEYNEAVKLEETKGSSQQKTTDRNEAWDEATKNALPESDIENAEALGKELETGTWGMLTGENQAADQDPDVPNEKQNKRAEKWLKDKGYNPQKIFGKYGGSENSFYVRGLTRADAIAFAKEFNQESVATNEGLVYQDGSMNPKTGSKTGGKPTNFYSTIRTKAGNVDMEVDYNFDEKVKPPKKTGKINEAADKARVALSTVAKDVKVVVHDTDADYAKATNEESREQTSKGEYNPKTKTIHINASKANDRTIAHEVFHAVLLEKVKTDANATDITKRMIKALARTLSPEMKAELQEFANNYTADVQSEEALAELVGFLAENHTKLDTKSRSVIKKWLDALAKMFGLRGINETDVADLLNTISSKVTEGKELTNKDLNILDGHTGISADRKRKQAEELFLSKDNPKLKSTKDVAKFIDAWGKENKLFDDDISNIDDDKVVKELAQHLEAELEAWDKVRGNEYVSFYDADIKTKTNPTLQAYAKENYGRELIDEEVKLFHLVSAFASPSANPYMDSWKGFYIFDRYMKTGELSGYSDKIATKWEYNKKGVRVDTGKPRLDKDGNPVRSKLTVAYSQTGLDKFNAIAEKVGGIEQAIEWITAKHSYAEMSDILGTPIKGVKAIKENEYISKTDGGLGIFSITGAKLGSYVMNRFGNFSTATKDMWYARTLSRLTGEKLSQRDAKTGKDFALKLPWPESTIKGRRKRKLADKAFINVAKKLGTSPAMIQERIWDFEKRMYESLGANEDAAYTSDGLNKGIQEAKKSQPTTARKQVDTPAFKKWFGDSKVVNSDGSPKVVYHGTTADFSEFSDEFSGSNTSAKNTKLGFFFTDDTNVANKFAEKSSVMPVYLALKNPIEVGYFEYLNDGSINKSKSRDGYQAVKNAILKISGKDSFNDVTSHDVVKWKDNAIKNGSDGIIIETQMDAATIKRTTGKLGIATPHKMYLAFSPAQIKSATGNEGTFDATNPDIRKQVDPRRDRVFDIIENTIFPKVDIRKRSEATYKARLKFKADKAIAYLQTTAWYETADDTAREEAVRDVMKMAKQRIKRAPSVAVMTDTKREKVLVDVVAALKDQIRLENRAARDKKKSVDQVRAALNETIQSLEQKGHISTKQAKAIMKRLNLVNLDNPVMVARLEGYIDKVFTNAENIAKLNTANSLRKKVRKAAKQNGKRDGILIEEAKRFASILPNMVEDIDMYNEMAANIIEGLSSSKPVGDSIKWRKAARNGIVDTYNTIELKRQEEALLEKARETFSEMTGIDAKDMSSADMKAILEEEQGSGTNAKAIAIRDYAVKAFNSYSSVMEYMLETGEDTFGDIDVDLSTNQQRIIKAFLKIDLKNLSTKEIINAVDALSNFMTNYSVSGMEATVSLYEGRTNAIQDSKAGIKAKPLKQFFSKKAGRLMLEQLTTIPILFERFFGGARSAIKMMDRMGFSDYTNGANKAEATSRKVFDKYKETFDKSKPNGESFDSVDNTVERGMSAYMRRERKGTDDKKAEDFATKKGFIETSIENLKNGNEIEQKMAEVYQKVYDKILKDANSIQEVVDKTDGINNKAIESVIEIWESSYDQMRDAALGVYGESLDKDTDYTPDIVRSTENKAKTEEGDLFDDKSAISAMTNTVYSKKSGVLHERKMTLPPKGYMSLDFDRNNENSYTAALVDVNTAAATQKIKGYMSADSYDNIFQDTDDAKMLKTRVTRYIRGKRGRELLDQSEMKHVARLANAIGSLGTAKVLGGLYQVPKQTISVAANTLINGGALDLSNVYNKDVNEFINRSGFGIANRGGKSSTMLDNVSKALDNKLDNWRWKAVDFTTKASTKLLEVSLVKPDVVIARGSWITYYKKSLKEQGINPHTIDWASHEANKKAGNYAEHMVNRQQNTNDADLQGELFTSTNSLAVISRKVAFSFMNFLMNQKARMYSDISTLSHSSTRADKKAAVRSIVGLGVEMAVFNAVSYQLSELTWSLVSNMMGYTADDEEEAKRVRNKLRGRATNMTSDFLSPVPFLTDMAVVSAVNKGIDTYFGEEEGAEKFHLYDKNSTKFLDRYGSLGIPFKMMAETEELLDMAINGEYQQESFGTTTTKYISSEDQEVLQKLIGPQLIYAAGLFPSEMNTVTYYAKKIAKKNAKTGNQIDTANKKAKKAKEKKYSNKKSSRTGGTRTRGTRSSSRTSGTRTKGTR